MIKKIVYMNKISQIFIAKSTHEENTCFENVGVQRVKVK